MKLRILLAAATCLALPLAAQAQPVTGPYVGLEFGANSLNAFNYTYSHGLIPSGTLQTNLGIAGVGSIGYGFGDGFRVQLDGVFAQNSVHSFHDLYAGQKLYENGQGNVESYGPMVNVLYDLSLGLPVFPYVGAGVGYQLTTLSPHLFDAGTGDTLSGTHGSFAYDVIAGLSYPIAAVPGLSVTGEYRFTQMVESRNYTALSVSNINQSPFHIGQISEHSFMLGLRYQLFNAPVAAPPVQAPMAAPAPAPAKTYLVFFDWNKSNLTPRAEQVIAQAAIDSQAVKLTTINVSGYTDTSGTPTYNQGLSVRRAKAVAVKLMADGVPAAEISIHGYGETHLLVPTGPGVREPQNRRVEIVLN
ncbi:MAG: OmpA family protein [Acidocella sp.]|nr:OmpA family protein [Acidocella sp.]MDE8349813.1 OmpA family protein [Acidocella sp.]